MKKILFVLTALAIVLSISSCGNKKKKAEHPAGTHVHEDGTVHSNDAHNHEPAAKPDQESFEVENSDTEHKHEGNGHDHEHGDGEGHDHDHEH